MATPIQKGQKIKFVVSSAEEAVNLIRQEMGPSAKVLSVRQVEGKGLARFLTAPKLEIVATLPDEKPDVPAPNQAPAPEFSAEEKSLLEAPAPASHPAGKVRETSEEAQPKLEALLRSAGFENSLIRRFEASTDWTKLQRVPVKTALNDLARRLLMDYGNVKVPATTRALAFMGPSGVGKTTALCKQLAHEVFFERRSVQVYKLDGGAPNADTALALYCEVMGVPLIRDAKLIDPTAALLVDTSGISLGEPEEALALRRQLDALGVQTRVWVINAAYDNSMIDRSFAVAEEIAATHSVYTHLDEIRSSSRLWQFVLSGRMPPLFGSIGPGIAHDRAADISSILLQKTFPEYLLK